MLNLFKEIVAGAKSAKDNINSIIKPPEDGHTAADEFVISKAIVKNTRGYIERIVNQINGTYERGWFDACAVLLRRLLETVIIEAFEANNISHKIKDSNDNFFFLSDLIAIANTESSWNLGRNTKKALPNLKNIGDRSAHSRRFVANRSDIDKIIDDVRVTVQEFIFLAKLK